MDYESFEIPSISRRRINISDDALWKQARTTLNEWMNEQCAHFILEHSTLLNSEETETIPESKEKKA